MAYKFSELTALTTPATGDLVPIVDISDLAQAASGTTKKMTYANFVGGILSELAITSSVAELNILDGVTSTPAELNILDGATLTVTELNYLDGVTSAIQTQMDLKAPKASPTFTGTVILPKTIEIQDTSADHQYVLAVSELTADRTVTLPLLTGNDDFVFEDHTQTLTNKRITKRSGTVTSHATPTINTDNVDIFTITALAEAITSMTTNLSGTPTLGQTLIIRILDNATARAITWGASFASRGATLPTTTVLSKYLYVGLIWNTTTSTWDCIATAQEA